MQLSQISPFDPAAYGLTSAAPVAAHYDTSPGVAQSSLQSLPQPWHPDNPLFWLGIIVAASLGCIGFTVTGRAGPARASAGVGKT